MERHALDTDILIDFLRGRDRAVSAVAELERRGVLATTVVNAFELYWGAYKLGGGEKALDVRRLLDRLELLPLGCREAEKAGEEIAYLEGLGLAVEIRDLLIGVIARENGYAVVTADEDHFRRIRGLRVINWRRGQLGPRTPGGP